ncbi:FMO [Acanthosepion pharaonis]|uniref:Flavin-containing monooxygenase n=1 Tax=Acanthosepion pharaonis TaxID=158019 RepID=A0A812C5K9_ACAPH|nr:FMO [Sepia pharaonis]
MPTYSGIATFSGQILHSQLYRKASDFSDKRVLVISIGNTGSEIAVELTTQAKQVYASTRNGKWFAKRLTPVDGTVANDIDVVIFATGYEIDYPFLEKSMLKMKDGKLFAYKHMFPPELIDQNFVIIGCIHVFGPAPPLHESQCRLATRLFKGLVKLPPKEVMLEEINATLDTQQNVDAIRYQDALCEFIGCKPNLCHLLLSDPYLGLNAIVGPCTPYQFLLPICMRRLSVRPTSSSRPPGTSGCSSSSSLADIVITRNSSSFVILFFSPSLSYLSIYIYLSISIYIYLSLSIYIYLYLYMGLVKLPPKEEILEEINATLDTQRSVDVIGYQDALCEFIGCKPNICHLLLSDPYLGLNAIFGPCTPYQFRLTGPGKWAGARSAILDQWKRMHYPTNKHLKSNLSPWIKDFLITFVIFFVLIQIFVIGIFLSK